MVYGRIKVNVHFISMEHEVKFLKLWWKNQKRSKLRSLNSTIHGIEILCQTTPHHGEL